MIKKLKVHLHLVFVDSLLMQIVLSTSELVIL